MTEQKQFTGRAWAELWLLGLIWGGSFLSIRLALDEIGPMTVVLHRTGWAALALLALARARGLRLPTDPRSLGAFLVMGLLNNILPFGLMAWGQTHVESGLVAILNASTALFGVIVAAALFRDEALTPPRTAGVLLGLGGVTLAIGPDALRNFDVRSLAQLAVIGGAVSYALAAAWARVRLAHLHPIVAAAGMLAASTLMAAPLAIALEGPPSLALSPMTWGAMGYFAVVATAGAYLLYYRILARVGSGNLMVVTLVIPPVAILLGRLALDESMQPEALAGFGLIAAGLILIDGRILRRRRSRPC